MGIFSVNYEAAEQFAAIEDGTYEVYVAQAEQSATQNGTDFLDIRLKIRDDFQQKFRNNLIFDKIYVNKSTLEYPIWVLQMYCKAAKVPENTDIQTIEQFLDLIKGKSMKVTVKNETSEWNGKTYENLRVKNREQSELAPYSAKAEKTPEVSDLDLPF
ncbi:single strand DNA binding protein [Streptococcus phage 858]|uniref:Orf38 n=1 Tax=Streptococcus phage 858 TaxID=2914004 RepID=B0YL88_9CAUD|nr:single strand DNA binding protein [Streptococcus phage 858]ABT18026.1 orf38 [Streptococcus phage 858]